jgi:hypothetical protein
MTNALILIDSSDVEIKMSNIDHLVQLQTDIAADHMIELVERYTFPYIPLKLGYLQDSFNSKIISNTPNFQADLTYSSRANNYFDYAEKQHENPYYHPIKGTDHFMLKGTGSVNPEYTLAQHIRKVL